MYLPHHGIAYCSRDAVRLAFIKSVRASLSFTIVLLTYLLFTTNSECYAQNKEGQRASNKTSIISEQRGGSATVDSVVFNWEQRELGKAGNLTDSTLSVSPIGNFLTINFRDANVTLQNPDEPLIGTWTGSIRVPITAPRGKRFVQFLQQLRFDVDKDEGTRVVFVLDKAEKK